jgi:penicillin-binding protein 2
LKTYKFDPVSSEIFQRQLRFASLFVLSIFSILILRLWFLQVVKGPVYLSRSENNRIRLQYVDSSRGMILDRNGDILVDNRPSYDLYVIPEDIQDRADLFSKLQGLIELDPDQTAQQFNTVARSMPFKPVLIKKDISRDELARIETHGFDLPGIVIKVKPQRRYSRGDLAPHVLGYLGEVTEKQLQKGTYKNIRSGDLIGKTGIEWKWQTMLHGIRGGEQVEVDAAGRKIQVISRKAPISGSDVFLTIDTELQTLAKNLLLEKHGAIVCLNPMNGEILALASTPSFDPNLFIKGIDRKTWKEMVTSKDFPLQNRALTGQYPPGSVFKIVVALAALQEGVITADEEIFCGGAFFLGKSKFRCWKKYGHGKVNLHKALVESCDVYFYTVGKRLGIDKIAKYAKLLGMGRESGLALGNEKNGLVPTKEWKMRRYGVPWQTGETISCSIGQSFVLATPIQMATLISAVFNGGVIHKPQITKWIREPGGERTHRFTPQPPEKLGIKKEYLNVVKNALCGVVNEPRGTAKKARVKGFTVAGKTGTAQVIAMKKDPALKKEEEIPWKYRDHAWFIALAPAEAPEIAVAVIVEHGGHGGSAAAPIAKELIETFLAGKDTGK